MSKELITVVTVCFNAGQTIAKTMQSVLNQTYRPLEYILVDGKSTDNTLNSRPLRISFSVDIQ